MKTKNLSYRLSIYFLISAIILSGIIILVGYFYAKDLIFESNRYRLQYEVSEILDDVENSMNDATWMTKHLALDINPGIIQKELPKYMSMVFAGHPNIYSFGIATSNVSRESFQISDYTIHVVEATFHTDTIPFTSKNTMTGQWINQMAFHDTPEWSPPFYDEEIGARAVIFGYPFKYLWNGITIHATFFCAVNLGNKLQTLDNQKMIKTGFAALLNERNQIVYHPDYIQTGQNIESVNRFFGNSGFDVKRLITEKRSGYQLLYSISMKIKRAVVIYWPVRISGWYMIMVIPEDLFISQIKRILLVLIPFFLFAGSVIASIIIYNSIRLVSPISNLANDSRKMAEDEARIREINLSNPEILYDSALIWQLSHNTNASPSKDIEALKFNLEKIKGRLANYRQSSIQNSLEKREMDRELNLARDIEMKMVPTDFPLYPGRTDFDCFGRLIPAKMVGGDLFDLFLLDDKQLFISITDTVGKGIPAAMYSVMTRTFIRSIANPITRLGKMMESLNEALSHLYDSDMFATVFLAILDLATGELTYCNAGHPHPFILRKNNREEVLDFSQGIPVGVKANLNYSENRITLGKGESLILYTDGITEQTNNNGTFFGIDGLITTVKPLREKSAQYIVNKTLSQLELFRGNLDVHDDTTLVVVKYLG